MPSARGCISEYVHRIGRTGSAGKKGFALTFLEEVDLRYAREIYDMLEASGQTVPSWLKEAASNWKRYKNMFLQKKRPLCQGQGSLRGSQGHHQKWPGRLINRRLKPRKQRLDHPQGQTNSWPR
eukprot:gb/GFBE01051254.1/.p1 GENE.gb/GFBE01051254.1/~~gb/GFBE01051254.1/.p1  ORF type:complete len:124 (+),score=22.46 gb/GFBE01051254.1/:1-372(+)